MQRAGLETILRQARVIGSSMARVASVDEGLVRRTREVLLERQNGDGAWTLDREMHTWAGVDDPLA